MERLDECSRTQVKPPVPLPDSVCFTHDAMNTTFALHLCGVGPDQLASLSRQCSERLDELEGRLSRFRDTSDIAQINSLQAGETFYPSDDCHRCLLLAIQAYGETGGLFDITLGTRIEQRKAGVPGPLPASIGRLIIHPDAAAVTCEIAGRELDLGGIGKGFALDELKNLLLEWQVPGGLLSAGGSTLLAFGPHPWPVDLAAPDGTTRLALQDESLSASGTDMQGSHIVPPWDESETPDYLSQRVWTIAGNAALADAWSTALMLMTHAEVLTCLTMENSLLQAFAELDGQIKPLK